MDEDRDWTELFKEALGDMPESVRKVVTVEAFLPDHPDYSDKQDLIWEAAPAGLDADLVPELIELGLELDEETLKGVIAEGR